MAAAKSRSITEYTKRMPMTAIVNFFFAEWSELVFPTFDSMHSLKHDINFSCLQLFMHNVIIILNSEFIMSITQKHAHSSDLERNNIQ